LRKNISPQGKVCAKAEERKRRTLAGGGGARDSSKAKMHVQTERKCGDLNSASMPTGNTGIKTKKNAKEKGGRGNQREKISV